MSSIDENLKPNVVVLSTSDLEEEIKGINEELKKFKGENEEEHRKIYEILSNLSKMLNWINVAKSQAIWKSKTCKHSVNFTCQAWNISDEEKLGIPSEAIVINQDGTKKVIVSKFPDICMICPLYEARRS
ncbi:MAG: hypothetical protein RRA45_03220 [Saccharolobus sp.]|jgi:phage-related protein|uniref:hypothetical protein n=1 Tax=Saccharolobus sp. TaxID=2100761 RepID=UPI0028CEE256|nr:hypothetical protein [Saccharolobus sp.]MDT7861216.1 hypothetical protein [Saccharolobus sp.]